MPPTSTPTFTSGVQPTVVLPKLPDTGSGGGASTDARNSLIGAAALALALAALAFWRLRLQAKA